MKSFSIIIVFLLLAMRSFAETEVTRDFIKSTSTNDKIEFYWSKPNGKGPFPALLMIHPEQSSPKNGGESFVKYGQLDYWRKKGFFTIAISQPGYGGSQGSADFCGPRTQNATLDVIKHFQSIPEITQNFFFIYGGSRGAVVASMIATKEVRLAGVILKSGVYDFKAWNQFMPWYDLIKLQMLWEIGWLDEEKLQHRSAQFFADKIKTPLLIIYGTQDDRAPIELAEKFVNKVNASGGKAQLIKIESEHVIPMPQINGVMEEFIHKLL